MKRIALLLMLLNIFPASSQKVEDLFQPSDVKISWLGIDYSHVKLIGDFAQFYGAGRKSMLEIRNDYFPAWNKLILKEPHKYDLMGMLRKDSIYYDLKMIMKKNDETPLETLEDYNTPNYSADDIKSFVKEYKLENTEGIGIVFIAESLDKYKKEAYFHFVAINLKDKTILLQKRLRGEPSGFGLRNYWAGAIHAVIKDIENRYYRKWKRIYVSE